MPHRLSDVDPYARTALCSECGPVSIRVKAYRKDGSPRWRCNTRHTRRYAYRQYSLGRCERCKFVPEHASQLDVHHLDGDHSNNEKENLMTLCANCHRLAHVHPHYPVASTS